MILTFSRQEFKDRIESGKKIHTIRADAHQRWKPGMNIQFWMHNPRNKSKNPHQFMTGQCFGLQDISIVRQSDYLTDTLITIDGHNLTLSEMQSLAWNDGFANLAEFLMWFRDGFVGKIIHWTDFKYSSDHDEK